MPKKAHKIEVKKTKKPRAKKKISHEDLLPESREFLQKEAVEQPIIPPKIENVRIAMPREEFHKKMIMWSGISLFMVLIFGVWVFNAGQVFRETAKMSVSEENQELGEVFKELNSVMQEAKSGLDQLNTENGEKNVIENKLPANEGTDEINELKIKLENVRTDDSPRQ